MKDLPRSRLRRRVRVVALAVTLVLFGLTSFVGELVARSNLALAALVAIVVVTAVSVTWLRYDNLKRRPDRGS
jgi:hypothetical protein